MAKKIHKLFKMLRFDTLESFNSKKCFIVASQSPYRCLLVVYKDDNNQYSCRLPLLRETTCLDRDGDELWQIKNELFLLKTKDEISPQDFFAPFPPSNYIDYGYLILKDKSGKFNSENFDKPKNKTTYNYWSLLSREDKSLIEFAEKKLTSWKI